MDRYDNRPADGSCIPTAHFRRLIDDTGIFQHCNHAVPNWRHGYCLDDVARAMIVMCGLHELGDRSWTTPLTRCASFVDAALDGPMTAHNFLSFDRTWIGGPSQGDHVGRAIWSLGELSVADHQLAGWARASVGRVLDQRELLRAPLMTRVFALLGLSRLGAKDSGLHAMIADTCMSISTEVEHSPTWPWPETRVRYDAGRIPQALIDCGAVLEERELVDAGLHLLAWLDRIMSTRGVLRVVGHLGLGPGDLLDESGDEQPVEVAALAAAHESAARVSGNVFHASRIDECLAWFDGVNRLGLTMIDPQTGATHDGLGATARNDNQGAESTIAYLMTALSARRHCQHESRGVTGAVRTTQE